MKPIEGGCFCGEIRYRISGDPLGVRACYCRKCQYAGPGGPNVVVMAPKSGFEILRGEPTRYSSPADSGNDVARLFCGRCGTLLYSDSSGYGTYAVRVGSLDDPAPIKPQASVWTEAAQPWHHVDPDIPAFPKGAPPPR
jgi:hypothetical protein